MNRSPNQNSQNTVVALIAITGLSVASQSGLVSQLFRVLDRGLVTPASAQEWRVPAPRYELDQREFDLREMDIRSIEIQGDRAYQITEEGDREILPDGYYKFPDSVFLTVKEGRVIDREIIGSGDNFHPHDDGSWSRGMDDGGWGEWIRECPECDNRSMPAQEMEMPQRPNVRDTYNRIRRPQVPDLKPSMPGRRPQPDPMPDYSR